MNAIGKISWKILLIFVEFTPVATILKMLNIVIIDEPKIDITQYANFGLRQVNLDVKRIALIIVVNVSAICTFPVTLRIQIVSNIWNNLVSKNDFNSLETIWKMSAHPFISGFVSALLLRIIDFKKLLGIYRVVGNWWFYGKGVILREKRSRKYRIKIFLRGFVFEKIDFEFSLGTRALYRVSL